MAAGGRASLRCDYVALQAAGGRGSAAAGGFISGVFPRCYRSDIATLHSATLAATPRPPAALRSTRHTSTTPALHPPHITFVISHMQLLYRCVSHLHYICITSALHLYHICITFVSHLCYICDIATRQPPGSHQAATRQPPGSHQVVIRQPPGSYQVVIR